MWRRLVVPACLLCALSLQLLPAEAQEGPNAVVRVTLDRFLYDSGMAATATVQFVGAVPAGTDLAPIILATPDSQDVEVLTGRPTGRPGEFKADAAMPIVGGAATPLDGKLSPNPGELIFAYYFLPEKLVNKNDPEAELKIFDFGMLADPNFRGAELKVDPRLAMTDDETKIPVGGKKIGTVVRFGMPIQLPVEELVLFPRDSEDLKAFLDRTDGKVIMSDRLKSEANLRPQPSSYLIQVDPSKGDVVHLNQMRALFAETDPIYASNPAALGIYALAMELHLEGFVVGVNPRLQSMGAPSASEVPSGAASANLTDPMFDLPQVWAYKALWDSDISRVRLALLDMGFAPNPDFRPDTGPWIECDMGGGGALSDFTCGPGQAVGPPTVGNSFFGSRSWHGTGVVTTSSGVVNNGWGSAGTGGQVAVPMLYEYNMVSYAFEIGLGIRKAAMDGASVISISAGYPCRIIDNIGIEFNICDPAGRLALCATVTAASVLATAAICAVAAGVAAIPFVGPILAIPLIAACAVASIATAALTVACFALLIPGNLQGHMADAVNFARSQGVVVVSISGNNMGSVPEPIRSIINTGERRAERWNVIPGVIPGVICVAAAQSSPPYGNIHFFGTRVDIWAPIPHNYWAPPTVDAVVPGAMQVMQSPIGGTSAAAPYIAGLICDMMAINPQLNPRTPGLSAAARAAIPDQIRSLLVNTAWTNAELNAIGHVDPAGERGNLVNPNRLIRRVALMRIPDFEAMGYDDELDRDETTAALAADTVANARDLGVAGPRTVTGTILYFRGEPPGGVPTRDTDWFALSTPAASTLHTLSVHLITPPPDPFGELVLSGAQYRRISATPLPSGEVDTLYRSIPLFPSIRTTFEIRGNWSESDNVYKLRVEAAANAGPLPAGDRFDSTDAARNPVPSRPNNDVAGRAAPLGTGDAAFPDLNWGPATSTGALSSEQEIRVPGLNHHRATDQDWFRIPLPPTAFHEAINCRPLIEISFGRGQRLRVFWSGDLTHPVLDTQTSPAELDRTYLGDEMVFVLEAAVPGSFITYDLLVKLQTPDEAFCRLLDRVHEAEQGRGGRGVGGSGPHPFPEFFPGFPPALIDSLGIKLPPGHGPDPLPFQHYPRAMTPQGLITTPDTYVIDWAKNGDFLLGVELTQGSSLQLRFRDATGRTLAQTSVGLASAGPQPEPPTSRGPNRPLLNPSNLGQLRPPIFRPDLNPDIVKLPFDLKIETGAWTNLGGGRFLLRLPNLGTGLYALQVSHGAPGTQFDLLLPRNAIKDGSMPIEAVLGRAEPPPGLGGQQLHVPFDPRHGFNKP